MEKIPWIEDHVVSYHQTDTIRIWRLEPLTDPPPYYRVDMKKLASIDPEPYRWIPLTDAGGKRILYQSEDEAIGIGVPLAEEFMNSPEWDAL